MRIPILIAAAFMALAGCTDVVERSVDKVAEQAAAPGEGWTMQVIGDDDNAVYLVTGPNGQRAAARIAGGVSSLIGDAEAQGFAAMTQSALAADAPPEKVSIKAPGVSIHVSADEDANNGGGRGKVAIEVGGVSINVDGDDDGGGRGAVRIAGVNADAATKFINDIDALSPEVKAQMREKLGL